MSVQKNTIILKTNQIRKKKNQSKDQDHSTLKHGLVVAQIFPAKA